MSFQIQLRLRIEVSWFGARLAEDDYQGCLIRVSKFISRIDEDED